MPQKYRDGESLDWRRKLEKINLEYSEFKKKISSAGLTIEKLERYMKLQQIEGYIKKVNKDIIVLVIDTRGIRTVILTSKEYPDVGILVFDGYVDEDSPYSTIRMTSVKISENNNNYPEFSLVCGDSNPHLEGVDRDQSFDREVLRNEFISAIRKQCKLWKISILFFIGAAEIGMQQEEELRLVNFFSDETEKYVDKYRFAVAFQGLTIYCKKYPFNKLFQKGGFCSSL